jgi:hypothetical protein
MNATLARFLIRAAQFVLTGRSTCWPAHLNPNRGPVFMRHHAPRLLSLIYVMSKTSGQAHVRIWSARQILGPRRHLPKLANGPCRHPRSGSTSTRIRSGLLPRSTRSAATPLGFYRIWAPSLPGPTGCPAIAYNISLPAIRRRAIRPALLFVYCTQWGAQHRPGSMRS